MNSSARTLLVCVVANGACKRDPPFAVKRPDVREVVFAMLTAPRHSVGAVPTYHDK